MGVGGGKSLAGVFFPPLPLASRAGYVALIGRLAFTLPFTLAVVSIGGRRLRAGYISRLTKQRLHLLHMKSI